jgi:hypothetical protein
LLAAANCRELQLVSSPFEKSDEVCATQVCGENLCSADAICQDNERCICPAYKSTWPEDNPVKCCYKRRDQKTAFIIEVVVSFGIGLLYVGRFGLGGAKMFTYLFFLFLNVYWYFVSRMKNSEYFIGNSRRNTAIVSIVVYLSWQIVDIILFALNIHTDRQDVYPEGW